MKNIVNFCRKHYKILIPIMVGIVLLVTIFFLYKEYQFDNKRNKEEVSVFQYFGGLKEEYTAIVTYNLKNSIVDIDAKDKKIEYDSVPIYYKEEEKVIFPEEMNIVFPLRGGSQFKLYKYTTYYLQDNLKFIKSNTDFGNYDFFFLYDGSDVFFFPDEVTLNIDNNEYKKLGAMSYVRVVGGLTLIYFDTESDSGEVIELDGRNVSVSSQYINVNISERYFKSFSSKVLLTTPNNLNPLFKTIDK